MPRNWIELLPNISVQMAIPNVVPVQQKVFLLLTKWAWGSVGRKQCGQSWPLFLRRDSSSSAGLRLTTVQQEDGLGLWSWHFCLRVLRSLLSIPQISGTPLLPGLFKSSMRTLPEDSYHGAYCIFFLQVSACVRHTWHRWTYAFTALILRVAVVTLDGNGTTPPAGTAHSVPGTTVPGTSSGVVCFWSSPWLLAPPIVANSL